MSADAATPAVPRTLWRDDLVAALTGGLLILGLFVDGWNHLNLQNGKAGEFLTPWHGLLYAGFNACAIWAITRNERLRAMMLPGRGAAGAGRLPAIRQPSSTQVALIGLALAAAGIVGDGVARSTGLRGPSATMSPPFDFLLFTGAGLIFAISLRALAVQVPAAAKRLAVPAVLSAGAAAAAVLVFGGQAATKSVDKVVASAVDATPSVVQSAPRTFPATHRAPKGRAVAHTRAPRATGHARPAGRHQASATVLVASPAAAPTTHDSGSAQQTPAAVQLPAASPVAPRRRTAARPAPQRHAAARPHPRFTPVAVPDVPAAPTETTVTTTTSSASATAPAPAVAKPAQSPTAAPTPTTAPAAANPPATPPSAAAKHGGQGPG